MLDKIKSFITEAQKYAKAIVAGTGAVLIAISDLSDTFGIVIVPADVQPYITFTLAILTAFATWAVPNATFVADPYNNGLGTLPGAGE